MKQSTLKEENKKYKKINILGRANIKNTNCELRIVSSIKRISTRPHEVDKIFYDTSKASPCELHKQIALTTEEIIHLFFDMELSILAEGAVPLMMGEKLYALKAIISLCKIQLCLPELNKISFPESFIEEYSRLLERTDRAIEAMKIRIEKLKTVNGSKLLTNVLEKNLLTLNMLRMHYISALGLPDIN